jgi:hypothetical protein
MDDEPRRLVDDEHVLVRVRHAYVDRLGFELGRGERRDVGLDRLATLEPVALRAQTAIDSNGAGEQQAFRSRA